MRAIYVAVQAVSCLMEAPVCARALYYAHNWTIFQQQECHCGRTNPVSDSPKKIQLQTFLSASYQIECMTFFFF